MGAAGGKTGLVGGGGGRGVWQAETYLGDWEPWRMNSHFFFFYLECDLKQATSSLLLLPKNRHHENLY